MTTSLLEPAFVRELEALRRLLRPRTRSGQVGGRSAPRRGGGAEFQEHRAYAPGDDVGRVDWAAFARTGQPVLKQYRADEDTVVRLLLDASRSLDFGEPTKLDVATRIAAGVAYLATAASERTQVMIAGGSARPRAHSPGRAGSALGTVLGQLTSVKAAGSVDLADSVERTLGASARPGMLVVISDFLDPGPVTEALRRARFEGHDVAVVQILTREELEPTFDGDWVLEDSETGATLDLTADSAARGAYEARLAALFETLRAFARTAGATYVRASTDERLAEIVRRIVARGID